MKKLKNDVDISGKKLRRLPKGGDGKYTFSDIEVDGNFNCADNEIDSLAGCPAIVKGHFVCYLNKLKDLAGAPAEVHGDFICGQNLRKFTVSEVQAVCKVHGKIYVESFITFNTREIEEIIADEVSSMLYSMLDTKLATSLMNTIELDDEYPDVLNDVPADISYNAANQLWVQFTEHVKAFKPDRKALGI